jgi:excisionase family DNA binding protein
MTKDVASTGPESPVAHLIDVPQAATYLGRSETFIRRLIAARLIRTYRVGRVVRIDPVDLAGVVREIPAADSADD